MEAASQALERDLVVREVLETPGPVTLVLVTMGLVTLLVVALTPAQAPIMAAALVIHCLVALELGVIMEETLRATTQTIVVAAMMLVALIPAWDLAPVVASETQGLAVLVLVTVGLAAEAVTLEATAHKR